MVSFGSDPHIDDPLQVFTGKWHFQDVTKKKTQVISELDTVIEEKKKTV